MADTLRQVIVGNVYAVTCTGVTHVTNAGTLDTNMAAVAATAPPVSRMLRMRAPNH